MRDNVVGSLTLSLVDLGSWVSQQGCWRGSARPVLGLGAGLAHSRPVPVPFGSLTEHPLGAQSLDVGCRVARRVQDFVGVLPDRGGASRRHLALAVEMKRTRHRQALAVSEGDQGTDALKLRVAGAFIHQAYGAECHPGRA